MGYPDSNNRLWTFLAGAFGGVSPALLELAGRAQAQNFPAGGYYLAMGIFLLIGGAIALIYKETILHKAFLLGVACPALITATGGAANPKVGWIPASVPTVHAESLSAASEPGSPTDIKAPHTRRMAVELPVSAQFNMMVFRVRDDSSHPKEIIQRIDPPLSSRRATVEIPADSTSVQLRAPGTWTEFVDLPSSDSDLLLKVDVVKPFWSGFLEAFSLLDMARATFQTKVTIQTESK